MKHSLPAIASQGLQPQSRAGAPPLVAIVKCAAGRAAPDLLRDCVDQGLVDSLHLRSALEALYHHCREQHNSEYHRHYDGNTGSAEQRNIDSVEEGLACS